VGVQKCVWCCVFDKVKNNAKINFCKASHFVEQNVQQSKATMTRNTGGACLKSLLE